MRKLVLISFAILALSACESQRKLDAWHEQAEQDCRAKTDEFERQNCLDQVAAVMRTHEIDPDGPPPKQGPARPQ